jgi:mannose-6-phosphate isomerase-like protein (cupin superfamily)
MSKVGKTVRNPHSGETFTFIQTGREIRNEFLQLEWRLKPGGAIPPHLHTKSTETFEVKEGELTLMLNGDTRVLRPGDTLTVPMSAPHAPMNRGEQDAVCVVTVRPTYTGEEETIEAMCGLANDGFVDKSGQPHLLRSAVILVHYKDGGYSSEIPIFIQKLILPVLAFVGRLRGYKAYYPEYSGPKVDGKDQSAQ